ncbi:PEF-CTERM sorting domain-containing protein [Methanolobus sediminis]|uniref:PEF-CTERM sorting domain-containing protein n=1 Tax=Methanolobus sediminis TaxID=3072978 RepID=A0AA51UL73_9EURY|nr:PEF-CTERM sorting domain-containing protein [Methanolobus sediminis]WMW25627.1 PEF-CTERM sorting domain-containing protein [Methanolobus sediminis]
MRIKQNITFCGIALIFLIMFTGIAVAPPVDAPAISFEKSTLGTDGVWYDADVAPGPSIPIGGSVEWKYVVTNIGNVPLTDIYVDDDQIGNVAYIATLEVGQSVTVTVSGVAVAGQYENIGSASTSYYSIYLYEEDPSHYYGYDNKIPEFPAIALPIVAIIGLAFIMQRRRN